MDCRLIFLGLSQPLSYGMVMRFMVWSVIVSFCLLLPEHDVAAQQQPSACQLSTQQPRTDDTITNGTSAQVRLAIALDAICQLNGQQPRMDDSAAIATANTPSPENFTVPSLWWQERQVGEVIHDRFIENWRAYNDTVSSSTGEPIAHIDVVINSQLWPSLNYLERYSLLTQFGESAKSYGYQLRLFTGNSLVGLQACDFQAPSPTCIIELNYFGQGAIQSGSQP